MNITSNNYDLSTPATLEGQTETAAQSSVNYPSCISAPAKMDLSWRAVCAEIPKKYLGLGLCAWFGEKKLSRQYFTNIWMLANANPRLKVLVFNNEQQSSANSIEQLFAADLATTPDNIQLICAPCFLQANPVDHIHDEEKKRSASIYLSKFGNYMEKLSAYAVAKDELFNYISCFAPEEVFPEQSDCTLNRGWVSRVYFDLDLMCGTDLLANMHDIFNDRSSDWHYGYEMAKCTFWSRPAHNCYDCGNISLVVQFNFWKKDDEGTLHYYPTPRERDSMYFSLEHRELTTISGINRLRMYEVLSDSQHRESLHALFNSARKGIDIYDNCSFIYNHKFPDESHHGRMEASVDKLKAAIALHDFLALDETVAEISQPLPISAQQELVGYCVNTNNTAAFIRLLSQHNVGNSDMLTHHLPAALDDHNTQMSDTLLQFGANLHDESFEMALTNAIQKFQLQSVEYLLSLNPEATLNSELLNTTLMEAVSLGHIQMADWLLAHGAKIDSNSAEDYLFYRLIGCENMELWDWLYDHGFKSSTSNLSQSLYFQIHNSYDNEKLDWLVAHGATVDELPEDCVQALHWKNQNNCLDPRLKNWLKDKFPDFLPNESP